MAPLFHLALGANQRAATDLGDIYEASALFFVIFLFDSRSSGYRFLTSRPGGRPNN